MALSIRGVCVLKDNLACGYLLSQPRWTSNPPLRGTAQISLLGGGLSVWGYTEKQRAQLELINTDCLLGGRDSTKCPLGHLYIPSQGQPTLAECSQAAPLIPVPELRDTNFDHVMVHSVSFPRRLRSPYSAQTFGALRDSAPAYISRLVVSLPHQPHRSTTLCGGLSPSHRLFPLSESRQLCA